MKDRCKFAQLLLCDGPLPEDLQSFFEHMNNGGFNPMAAGSAIQYERDPLAKLAHHMLGGGRADPPESIGAGSRERFAEAFDHGTKCGVGTHSYSDRILTCRHDVRHRGTALQHHGQRSRPKLLSQREGERGRGGEAREPIE
jgi:hypothetical protein